MLVLMSMYKCNSFDFASTRFYPISFYQVPLTAIALGMMCIVGNLDVRVSAFIKFLLFRRMAPHAHTLRVSYVEDHHDVSETHQFWHERPTELVVVRSSDTKV